MRAEMSYGLVDKESGEKRCKIDLNPSPLTNN